MPCEQARPIAVGSAASMRLMSTSIASVVALGGIDSRCLRFRWPSIMTIVLGTFAGSCARPATRVLARSAMILSVCVRRSATSGASEHAGVKWMSGWMLKQPTAPKVSLRNRERTISLRDGAGSSGPLRGLITGALGQAAWSLNLDVQRVCIPSQSELEIQHNAQRRVNAADIFQA